MDPVARLATADDIPSLDWLQDDARAAIIDVRGGNLYLQECPPVTDWTTVIHDDDVVVLVAELDDIALGFMLVQLSAELDRGLITCVFVADGARELGLGDTMIEHAIAAVRRRGLHGIEAVALPGDRDTKNLYERAGITARKITVYRRLDPGSDRD